MTAKLWNDAHAFDDAIAACEASLERLGLDYLDLCLIHWAVPEQGRYVEAWKALRTWPRVDRSILEERVCTPSQLTRAASAYALDDLGEILPGMARNEFAELVAHHRERGRHTDARALSDAAFGVHPRDDSVRSVFASCWLPIAPRRSREIIGSTGANPRCPVRCAS